MRFTKMHGCGNDYVVVEAMAGELADRYAHAPLEAALPLAKRMNDRRFGVGADGFVLILPETRADSSADYEMRMYNPDGSYSAMCGNALRCVAKRLVDSGEVATDTLTVRTAETIVPMRVVGRHADNLVDRVEADLGAPILAPAEIPCRLPAGPEGDLRSATLTFDNGNTYDVSILSMGNPHCVVFDGPDEFPVDRRDAAKHVVESQGKRIEHHEAFPERTNVEFVQVKSRTELFQRTWERGAGETWACGSGACAVAVAGVLTGRTERRVAIELLGGTLDLEWRQSDDHVLMTGPAVEVFAAEWTHDNDH